MKRLTKQLRCILLAACMLVLSMRFAISVYAVEQEVIASTGFNQDVFLETSEEKITGDKDLVTAATYSTYMCPRYVTIHGTKSNPVYFYRGAAQTYITDTGWDKYDFEATIWCKGYSYASNVGYRYIAEIRCGGGASAGQTITYYIPFTANVTPGNIVHKYGSPEAMHPHRAYCDCGASTTNTDNSCLSCYPAKIYYYANGGSGAPSTQTASTTPVYVSTQIPTRFPYKFNGWSEESYAQIGWIYPGNPITVKGNSKKELYATWESSKVLSVGEEIYTNINIAGTKAYFKFTPSETGKYTFRSTNTKYATYGYLYNANGILLASNYNGEEDKNFKIVCELTAGTTYYYGVEYYSGTNSGAIFVELSKEEHVHSYGSWTVVKVPTVDASGLQERTCSSCGKKEQQSIPKLDKPSDNSPFRDVKKGDYYYDAVLWAVDNNVTAGLSATTFGPHADCTRGQVVTFLWRVSGQPEPSINTTTFKDVPRNAYYYKAVLWAVEKNITSGYNASTFGSEDKVTRAQFVTFLWRMKGQPEPSSINTKFSDVAKGAYYYNAVLWASEKGVTAGYQGNSFAPDMTCSRAQVVSFLYRARNIAAVNNTFIESNAIQKYAGNIYTSYPVEAGLGMIHVSAGTRSSEMIIHDGYIYYIPYELDEITDLHRMKLDGSEDSILVRNVVTKDIYFTYDCRFYLYQDTLFYAAYNSSGSIVSQSINLKTGGINTYNYFIKAGNNKIWLIDREFDSDCGSYYSMPEFNNVKEWNMSKADAFKVYKDDVYFLKKGSLLKINSKNIGDEELKECIIGYETPGIGMYINMFGAEVCYRRGNKLESNYLNIESGVQASFNLYQILGLEDYEEYEIVNIIDGKIYVFNQSQDAWNTLLEFNTKTNTYKVSAGWYLLQ